MEPWQYSPPGQRERQAKEPTEVHTEHGATVGVLALSGGDSSREFSSMSMVGENSVSQQRDSEYRNEV